MIKKRQIIISALSAIMIIAALGAWFIKSLLCDQKLLTCRHDDVRLTLWDTHSIDLTLKLTVERGALKTEHYVIDKSNYGTLRMVGTEDLILLVNDQFIFAAYAPKTHEVIYHQKLENTLWDGEGTILDRYRYSKNPAVMRPDFNSTPKT